MTSLAIYCVLLIKWSWISREPRPTESIGNFRDKNPIYMINKLSEGFLLKCIQLKYHRIINKLINISTLFSSGKVVKRNIPFILNKSNKLKPLKHFIRTPFIPSDFRLLAASGCFYDFNWFWLRYINWWSGILTPVY